GIQTGLRPADALAEGRLNEDELKKLHAYWRAANYLSVGQIYLLNNPLLREPLQVKHVKPRLLGHWGTTPGLNFLYAHLNRVIKARDLDAIYICGPGHGGPGMVANAYLEGTYSEVYPAITRDIVGLQKLFRQFSFPGGIPSHDAPETPGSIHEGGELGYALTHAYGAAFDNPDLKVFRVIGDGDARSGPRRDRRDPGRGAQEEAGDASAVADDRDAHPEGMDRSEGSRRRAGRRHLAVAPGPSRRHDQAGTPSDFERVAA